MSDKKHVDGSRTPEVVTPLDLAARMAAAARIQEAADKALGMRDVRLKGNETVLPTRETVQAPSVNDRLSGLPDNGTRGAGDIDAETGLPDGYVRDHLNRIRPKNWQDFEREARERAKGGK